MALKRIYFTEILVLKIQFYEETRELFKNGYIL